MSNNQESTLDREMANSSSDEETTTFASKDKKKGHKGVFIEIGERMKMYEQTQGTFLDKTKPYMARLDGHKFSTFARPVRRPYDELLHAIMVQTAADLLEQFNDATTAYTQSDEITLTFPNAIGDDERKLPFGGKTTKLSTLLASYCSVRFNFNSVRLVDKWPTKEEYIAACPPNQTQLSFAPEVLRKRLTEGKAHFDARVFTVEDTHEFTNNIKWRSNYDCERNSRTNLGRAFFSTKEMNGLKAREVVEKLKTEKNIDWDSYPMGYKYGTFIKKTKYEKIVQNPKTGETIPCTRTRLEAFSFKIADFDPKYDSVFTLKTWNEVFENGILNPNELVKEPLIDDILGSNLDEDGVEDEE